MAVYSRTISRVATSVSLPAWCQAMTKPDTLYDAGAEIPNAANARIQWPHGFSNLKVPYGYNVEMGWWTWSGYSSGVWLPTVGGPFGCMVSGSGGHDAMGSELLKYNFGEDAPTFDWFQHPTFEVRDTGKCDLYYNKAEYDSLPEIQKQVVVQPFGINYQKWIDAGHPYPTGYRGWIFPRPMKCEEVAEFTPKGYRYYSIGFVPPELTGTPQGALFKGSSLQGPFNNVARPVNTAGTMPAADWIDPDYLGKSFNHLKDLATGKWSRLPGTVPAYTPYAQASSSRVVACKTKKRVYVFVSSTGGNGFYYVDFANGAEGATHSRYFSPKLRSAYAMDNGVGGDIVERGGRSLFFCATINSANKILWYDFDNEAENQFVVGPIPGLQHVNYKNTRWMYDAANHRIIIVKANHTGPIIYQTIKLPEDPKDVAGYVASPEITLSLAPGVTVGSVSYMFGKCFYHPLLGRVIIPQDKHRQLSFVPRDNIAAGRTRGPR